MLKWVLFVDPKSALLHANTRFLSFVTCFSLDPDLKKALGAIHVHPHIITYKLYREVADAS